MWVPDIYSVWKNQGWIAPEIIEESFLDRTILKLAFVKGVTDKKSATKIGDKKLAIKNRR